MIPEPEDANRMQHSHMTIEAAPTVTAGSLYT